MRMPWAPKPKVVAEKIAPSTPIKLAQPPARMDLTVPATQRAAGALRKGMWVKDAEGRVGLAASFQISGGDWVVEVHYTDDQGFNIDYDVKRLNELVQAGWKDIPGPRRPSKRNAARMGYK